MNRTTFLAAFCGALICGLATADEDAVEKKLTAAKGEHGKAVEKARRGLIAELKKKADAAQEAGALSALEKIEAEVKAFEDKGELPKSVPTNGYEGELRKAGAKLEDAYAVAVKEYTKGGQRAQAKATQRELDEFKKGSGSKDAKPAAEDGFGVGTKFTGTHRYSKIENGKQLPGSFDAELEITKRSGKEFTAELRWDNGTSVGEISGTIDGIVVSFRFTKVVAGNVPKDVVDNWTFSGQLDKGLLTGKTRKPKTPQQAYAGELKMKVSKE